MVDAETVLGALTSIASTSTLERARAATASAHTIIEDTIPAIIWDTTLPENLVARPCEVAAPVWHWRCLRAALADEQEDASRQQIALARAHYHTSMLAHLCAPDDPRYLPRVSIVIPVYNRAEMACEAVESCLAQTYANVEIVVVDDGSSDDLKGAMAPYDGRIVYHRKENGGVSSARNAGISKATGVLVHFLDSDNLLMPECVDLKVQAQRAVADAEFCYSTASTYDPLALSLSFSGFPVPDGDVHCATTNFGDAVARGFPALTSTILLPKWVALEVGMFDERFTHYEDVLFSAALGFRGTKAIGFARDLTERRRVPGSLSDIAGKVVFMDQAVSLLNLVDVLQRPDCWWLVFRFVVRFRFERRWQRIEVSDNPMVERFKIQLSDIVVALGDGRGRDGQTPLVALLLLLAGLEQLVEMGSAGEGSSTRFYTDIRAKVCRAIDGTPPFGHTDIAALVITQPHDALLSLKLADLRSKLRKEIQRSDLTATFDFLIEWASPEVSAKRRPLRNALAKPALWLASARGALGRARRSIRPEQAYLTDLRQCQGLAMLEALSADEARLKDVEKAIAAVKPVHAAPEGLEGAPCSQDFAQWNMALLVEALHVNQADITSTAVHISRVRYHAAWIAHALAPDDKRCAPTIDIVIPAYNRASVIGDTIRSCIAQTMKPNFIRVVDDGSTDNLLEALLPYEENISLHTQTNRGVSGARNRGLGVTDADFVYLLDSDDVLEPDCLATHFAAFRAIPDAGLSYCEHRRIGLHGQSEDNIETKIKRAWEGSPPASDLMLAISRGFIPMVGSTMLPLWAIRRIGGFDTWIKRAEDERYGYRLAADGAKAIHIDRKLRIKRQMPDSYWMARTSDDADPATIGLLNLIDTLERPQHWNTVFWFVARLAHLGKWMLANTSANPILERQRKRLLEVVSEIGDGMRRDGLSPAIALAGMFAGLETLAARTRVKNGRFQQQLERALLSAARAAPMLNDVDRAWLASADIGPLDNETLAHGINAARDGLPAEKSIAGTVQSLEILSARMRAD